MRRFLALVLVIVFVPLGIVLMWSMSLNRFIEQPDRIVRILHDNDLFAAVTNSLLDEQLSQLPKEQFASSPVSLENFQDVVKKTVSPEWLETEVNQLLVTFSRWLVSDESELHLNLDLTSIKQEGFHNLQRAIDDTSRSVPVCTESDVRSIKSGSHGMCRPTNMSVDAFRSIVNKQVDTMKDSLDKQIPNQIDLVELLKKGNPQFTNTFSAIHSVYRTVRQAIQWGFWSLFALLAAIGLLIWKPLYSVFRWIGASIDWLSGFAGGIAGALYAVVPEFMNNVHNGLAGGMPEVELNAIFPALSGTLIAFVRNICLPIIAVSGVLVAVSIILYIAAGILKSRQQTTR